MIKIQNVTKIFNGTFTAVDNISFQVNDGEIVGCIGPNGAGKTTTIKMITGILTPDQGNIFINDIDVVKSPIQAKKSFGFVSDNPDMFLRLKGIEYLNFMADIYDVPSKDRQELILQLADRFGLTVALKDPILSYSHGMRQKIMVMGALVHNPPVWILDEPLTGLDPKSAYMLKSMMREHASAGNTVFFSTHVLEVAEKLCDRVIIINEGRILFNGTLDEIKSGYDQNESLENIFLELTKYE